MIYNFYLQCCEFVEPQEGYYTKIETFRVFNVNFIALPFKSFTYTVKFLAVECTRRFKNIDYESYACNFSFSRWELWTELNIN